MFSQCIFSMEGKVFVMIDFKKLVSSLNESYMQVALKEPSEIVSRLTEEFFNLTGRKLIWAAEPIALYDHYHKDITLDNKCVGNLYLYDDAITDDLKIAIDLIAAMLAIPLFKNRDYEEKAFATAKKLYETLSYTERKSAILLLKQVIIEDSGSKLLVASKIADQEGLTRSVIVNSIRKMETASILVSKSLGMKGTIIKLTNRNAVQKFFELAKNKIV